MADENARGSNDNTVLDWERKETCSLLVQVLGAGVSSQGLYHVFHTEVPQTWLEHQGITMLLVEINSSHPLFLSLYFEDHLRCLLSHP